MKRKAVSGIMLTLLLLTSMLTLAFNIPPAKAWTGTVYIRADGSIDPPDAPIITFDNITYTLTDNITSTALGIVVERNNIVIDGAGYTLQGTQAIGSRGINLEGIRNMTIKNTNIKNFYYGIRLSLNLAYYSPCRNIKISGNNITNNEAGIWLSDTRNSNISGNNIIANNQFGIRLSYIWYPSGYNIISRNSITNNGYGVYNFGGSDNTFYHNNFVDNTQQVYFSEAGYANIWDDGYPSGGNFWSDYEEKYPNATEINDSGIWDTPYVIDKNNRDRYPLMNPWTPTPSTPDFSITASPTSLTIQQGSSNTSVITITSIGGFDQSVQLSVSGAPSGVIWGLSSRVVTPPPDGSTTSTLTVSVATTATLGSYTLTVTGTNGTLTHSVDIFLEITTMPPPEAFPQAGKFYTLVGRRVGWVIADGKNTTYYGDEICKWSIQDVVGDVAFVNRTWLYFYICPETGENWTITYDYDYEIAINRTIRSAYGKVMSFATTGFGGSSERPINEDVREHTWAWFPTDLYIGTEVLVSWTGNSSFLGDMVYEVVGEGVIQILDEKQNCWMLQMLPSTTTDGARVRTETYWVDKDTGVPLKLSGEERFLDGSSGWAYEYVLVHTNIKLGPESTQPPSPTYTLTVPTTPGFLEAGKFYTRYALDQGWYMSDATNVTWYDEGLSSLWVVEVTDDEALVYTIFWREYIHPCAEELEDIDIWYTVYHIDMTTREILSVTSSLLYNVNMTSLRYEGPFDIIPLLAGDVGEETDCWLPTNLYLGAAVNISWLFDKTWRLDNATYTIVDEEIVSALGESEDCWVVYLPSTPSIDGTCNWSETYYSDKDTGIPLILVGERWAVNGSDALKYAEQLIDTNVNLGPAPENQPPTCSIELQKDGVEINEIDVGEFFDIYVGDSTDDTGIVQVRFSSDDVQDGNPTGKWTNWYDWDISSEDWDASTRIKRWAFATGGDKEVWAEIKDEAGQTARCSANIYAIIPREKMLIKIITEEAIGSLPVTVDGQQYVILTLKSYIDPVTLEVTPDVFTKVYVEATKNYPVSDPEIARKIGIIDYARQISEKIEEMQWNKQALMNIKNVYTTLRLGDLTTAAINIYVSGVEVIRDTKTVADVLANIQTIKDFAQLKVPASWSGLLTKLAELAMRVLIYDPMKELENDLLSELSQAIESYASALGTLEGEITEHSTARSFLWSYLSAEAHKAQAIYLFKKFLDNYKLFIVKLISGLATGGLSNFVFLVKEAMDSLDWTITLIYNQIIASYENFAMVNYKLLESAEYTLELAGTPYELIHEYAIKYAEHVNEGYELAAEAVEMIITPMIPFFMRISIFSPVELRVYDSDGRVTGLENGEEINEITNSIYHENTVIILASNDSYLYEIVGVEEGSYGLEIERVSLEENETITFTSTDIPISVNATHQYTINWDSLSQGEEGVTIKVDSNGDGIFELTFTSDSELTQEEFKLQVPPVEAFPMWIVGVAVAAVAIVTAAIAVLWRRRKQPRTKG